MINGNKVDTTFLGWTTALACHAQYFNSSVKSVTQLLINSSLENTERADQQSCLEDTFLKNMPGQTLKTAQVTHHLTVQSSPRGLGLDF